MVIAGPPNAGKSTLLNRIARREAAIVSPIAGTTRDVIEVHLDLNGYPVNLIDTAGIRESSDDPVEREGMRRAREQAARANLVLWVVEATEADSLRRQPVPGVTHWTVLNKMDLVRPQELPRLEWQFKAMAARASYFGHDRSRARCVDRRAGRIRGAHFYA